MGAKLKLGRLSSLGTFSLVMASLIFWFRLENVVSIDLAATEKVLAALVRLVHEVARACWIYFKISIIDILFDTDYIVDNYSYDVNDP